MDDVAVVLGFGKQGEPNVRICDFLALLARNCEFTK